MTLSADQRTLTGKRLVLRRPSDQDIQARFLLGTDAEVVRMYGGSRVHARPMTIDDARRWIERLLHHEHAWIIEHDGRLIGEIRLDNVDLRDRRASLAIGIEDPKKLGLGLGPEADQPGCWPRVQCSQAASHLRACRRLQRTRHTRVREMRFRRGRPGA